MQCPSCLDIFNEDKLERHAFSCDSYLKLIKNEIKCGVCLKKFETKPAVKQHISANHKEKLFELQNQKSATASAKPSVVQEK